MPHKRRAPSSRNSAGTRQQSTLSFQNRVTKPSTAQHDTKSLKKDPERLERAIKSSEINPDVETSVLKDSQSTPSPAQRQSPTEPVLAEFQPQEFHTDQLSTSDVIAEDVLGGRAPQSDLGAVGSGTGSGWVGDEERTARKIPEKRIREYWLSKEAERLAPRVHQEGLTLHEKVLREWDMSGQYGPCIGIARLKRWKRANVLGLQPPLEVLAVLLKEGDKGNERSQRAHVDELMSSRFAEVA